ncbi:MAG: tRNA pseudouridine(38-40) synthase TruA [Ruminococcaceae bacterium]|nr:tRNA pseudouridine(38-40) synthase TruA [Oscillospiraceae bacterium]
MARRLMTIKYDGSAYCGWQVQPNAVSVQSTVQKALGAVLGTTPDVTGCSRTDSGVHAKMFCFHFDTESEIPNDKLVLAVNAHLPEDISAYACSFVSKDFHARYSSTGKTYIYNILNSKHRDPFLEKYSYRFGASLDVNLMNRAAECFVGTHDFKAFQSAGSSVVDTVRTVSGCSVCQHGDVITVKITADGFLYNMVRIIVGTLLEVATGKIDIEDLPEVIDSCDRNRTGPTARPEGLFLEKVHYDFESEEE